MGASIDVRSAPRVLKRGGLLLLTKVGTGMVLGVILGRYLGEAPVTDEITITFTATDECGLTATKSNKFTISDTTPPVIAGGADGTAECTGSAPATNAAYLAWLASNGGVTATDLCGAVVLSNNAGTQTWTSAGCTDEITITFTATDECGLTATKSNKFYHQRHHASGYCRWGRRHRRMYGQRPGNERSLPGLAGFQWRRNRYGSLWCCCS